MNTTIKKDGLEITATDVGAELISVKYNGAERMWQNENGAWSGHAPVLFPVCGACEMRVNGNVYPCPRHGFILSSGFFLAEKTDSMIKYRVVSDDPSIKMYPYNFILDVVYEIKDGALNITYKVDNPQEGDIYFSCGGHDSFALQSEPENYELVFEKSEEFVSKLVNQSGYLTGATKFLGAGRILDLNTDLLENSNSICLDKLQSRSVLLREKATGKAVAEVAFPQSEKLVLWRPSGAKMLCIEPWQNLPDRLGSISEYPEKDGVIRVAPCESAVITRTIKYF